MSAIIEDFLDKSSETVLHCPSDLNTYERMLLHEMAEEKGLEHESIGEGKKRHIVLKKSSSELPKKPEISPDDQAKVKKAEKVVVCSTCAREVPKANIELHKLKCTVNPKVDIQGDCLAYVSFF